MALPDFPLPPELATDEPPLADEDLALFIEHGPTDDEAFDHPEDYTEEAHRRARVQRWRVEDDDAAEWALRKMAVAGEELRRLREQADAWADRIQAWFDQAARTHARTVEVMEAKLADYGLRVREAGGPATITLPAGVIKTSSRSAAVEVEDDATVARYLDEVLLPDAEQPAWLAAWHKATEGMDEPLEVVKRTPKVYVGPLRKLVRVGEEDDGVDVRVSLACGHYQEFTTETVEDLGIPERGEVITCTVCPADSIDGDARVPVELVTMTLRKRPVAIGPDGEPVPGCTVRPAEVTAKVEAR